MVGTSNNKHRADLTLIRKFVARREMGPEITVSGMRKLVDALNADQSERWVAR